MCHYLVELETLLLDNNDITLIPDKIEDLKKLTTLEVCGNPMKHPPCEIADHGLTEIRKFLINEKKLRQSAIKVWFYFSAQAYYIYIYTLHDVYNI